MATSASNTLEEFNKKVERIKEKYCFGDLPKELVHIIAQKIAKYYDNIDYRADLQEIIDQIVENIDIENKCEWDSKIEEIIKRNRKEVSLDMSTREINEYEEYQERQFLYNLQWEREFEKLEEIEAFEKMPENWKKHFGLPKETSDWNSLLRIYCNVKKPKRKKEEVKVEDNRIKSLLMDYYLNRNKKISVIDFNEPIKEVEVPVIYIDKGDGEVKVEVIPKVVKVVKPKELPKPREIKVKPKEVSKPVVKPKVVKVEAKPKVTTKEDILWKEFIKRSFEIREKPKRKYVIVEKAYGFTKEAFRFFVKALGFCLTLLGYGIYFLFKVFVG